MISALIILSGVVYYFASPHYSFSSWNIRRNIYTGSVERYNGSDGLWKKMGEKKHFVTKDPFGDPEQTTFSPDKK